MKKPNFHFRKSGIRLRVMLGFAVFTVVIVALLWFFQIGLLNTFYRAIKTNEIKATASRVAELMDTGAEADDYFELVRETDASILISDEYGTGLVIYPAVHNDVLGRFTREDCLRLYLETKEAGGSVLQQYEGREAGQVFGGKLDSLLVYAYTAQMTDGTEYLILLSSSIVPVDSTVETLKVQLWCLTAVMILLSLVLALVISSRLSRPIEKINESAKLLGTGKYDIRFPMEGARETAELAATLNFAAEELSKVEDLRRELIANVSHDLRTPLTMIAGYAEVMRDLPGENTPENVQVIIDEAARLTGLVNDMLDLSKLEAGAMTLNAEDYNLTADIREILHRYDKLADFSFPFTAESDVYVHADRLKVTQVVYNLVNNAIHYCGADKTISIVQHVENNVVRISITDTGAGIPADQLPYIWDRYYKVDKSHARATVGTGLGLSIVKKILDLHGGRYGVASVEGKGSTFWFELQVAGI